MPGMTGILGIREIKGRGGCHWEGVLRFGRAARSFATVVPRGKVEMALLGWDNRDFRDERDRDFRDKRDKRERRMPLGRRVTVW